MICVTCNRAETADGWRVCAECHSIAAKKRLEDRKRLSKEYAKSRITPIKSKSMTNAEADEQIGGMSRCIRAMEDKSP